MPECSHSRMKRPLNRVKGGGYDYSSTTATATAHRAAAVLSFDREGYSSVVPSPSPCWFRHHDDRGTRPAGCREHLGSEPTTVATAHVMDTVSWRDVAWTRVAVVGSPVASPGAQYCRCLSGHTIVDWLEIGRGSASLGRRSSEPH